ncbi:hypothetical protein COU53_02630 [Candidatus Pacearchaeota archaeon CG10_big_fil_rev_8_21_14_0_10_30_48]|nr:MAG: hypothetical protein COU53_02630 [Candidatus Pacearchaeota archaeon CG10_big_fil_rev_8_21_14_0_10_30_48]
MKKNKGNVKFIIINFLRGMLILAFFMAVYSNRPLVLAFSIFGFLATFAPFISKKLFNTNFPAEYEIIILLSLYGLLFLGDVRGLFAEFWWWDVLLNLIASISLSIVGLTILYVLYKDKKINANPLIISFLTFSFAVAMGTVWEILEFALDTFFGFNFQKSLLDTMKDLSINMLGAMLVSIVGYSYIKNGGIKIVSEFIIKKMNKHPKFFGPRNTLEDSSIEILNLISKGEGSKLEFKSTLRTNLHTKEIDARIEHANMKTLAAFMNSDGGTLLIGVSDEGKVHGLENDKFKDNDALNLHFTNLLKTYIGAEFLPFINFELHPIEDRHVLKITCIRSKKPVFLRNKDDEEFYIRNGPSSVKLTGRSLIDYIEHNFRRE